MFERRKVMAIALAAAAFAALVPESMAITDEEIFRQLRFNFISPGGRTLGMGGTFIALADDATAAQANPAGLMQLAAAEFFVEERYIGGDKTKSTSQRSFPGLFTFDLASGNERRAVTTPTFFSYVHPFKHVAVGFGRQELINTRIRSTSSIDFNSLFGSPQATLWEARGEAAVQVTNWNASVAWRPIKWLSVGATGSFSQLHIDSRVENTILDPTGNFMCRVLNCTDTGGDGTIDDPDVIVALQQPHGWYSTRIEDDDTDITGAAGVLVLLGDSFSGGLVYRYGAQFEFDETLTDGLSSAIFATPPPGQNPDSVRTQVMHLPDSYGVGFKWRPTPNWTFVADGVRIKYTNLLDDLQGETNLLTNLLRPANLGGGIPDTEYTLDDATEVHIGAEYLFTGGTSPWALRIGAYNDPDNVLREDTDQFGEALQGRDDEIHGTAGFGIVLKEKFQADIAVSVSSIGTEGVVSVIYRF